MSMDATFRYALGEIVGSKFGEGSRFLITARVLRETDEETSLAYELRQIMETPSEDMARPFTIPLYLDGIAVYRFVHEAEEDDILPLEAL